jgi:multicomponent Na+:H+ antiporter subunit F
MKQLCLLCAVFLLATVGAGLPRVFRGPTTADRMLAVQLFGTTGVAVLLLLAKAWQSPVLLDVALVFALLAPVAMVALVRRLWIPKG